MKSADAKDLTRVAAIGALFLAGLGWGTTGLFVRILGQSGLSVYQLLIVRLCAAAVIVFPIFLSLRIIGVLRSSDKMRFNPIAWRPTAKVGLMMVFYYLGAITAFHNLQLAIAAVIIGSSPLIAWFLQFLIERRMPTRAEWQTGTGVGIAILGLLWLSIERSGEKPPASSHEISSFGTSLGLIGAVAAALITVFNARTLKRLGDSAPKPLEISVVTIVFGLALSPIFLNDFYADAQSLATLAGEHLWLCLGFGFLATAIPGLAIAFASTRLEPQATATVSIQLQVWAGLLAWIFLGETMTAIEVVACVLIIGGSWVTLRRAFARGET